MGYPILDLREWKRDVGAYVRAIEQTMIDTLADFGIQAGRIPKLTGVWVGERKIARHRRAYQPMGYIARFRAERFDRPALFPVHCSLRPLEAGDLHGAVGLRRCVGRSAESAGRAFRPHFRSRNDSSGRCRIERRYDMTDVVMPQMGESIVEGTLTKWLKKPGDHVERDEPLFEISTDKVDTEIPSPAAGTLSEVLVEEGKTVASAPWWRASTKRGSAARGCQPAAATTPAPARARNLPPRRNRRSAASPTAASAEEPAEPTGPLSPLVRRMAREYSIDLTKVKGTGAGGRITKQDLEGYIVAPAASARGRRQPRPPSRRLRARPLRRLPPSKRLRRPRPPCRRCPPPAKPSRTSSR